MATEGSSIEKGSGLIYDYRCSQCEEDDSNTEAQYFCPQCEHYLCDKCVNMHNGYHKKHTVYGREDIQKWAEISIDICEKHGNKLEVNCDDHKELCCHVCVAVNHRKCSSISHLPVLAKGFLQTAEFKQLPAAVSDIWSSLDQLKYTRMKYHDKLKDSYNDIIAEIKALRKRTNEILDQLEKTTVDQLNSLMIDVERRVIYDVEICSDMHARLKTVIHQLQQVTGKHKEINSYIGFRKCQIMLNEAKRVVQEVQRRPTVEIRYKSDENVLPFLKKLNNLGNADRVYSMPRRNNPSVLQLWKIMYGRKLLLQYS